jgi:4-aminobutyrate aminotransferase-like enzyme/Ser/Thr protein kinase RdoA (MazF antagonist)
MKEKRLQSATGRNYILGGILGTKPPDFSEEQVVEFARELYGLTGVISPLDSERDQNFLIKTATGDMFVIKIANQAVEEGFLRMVCKALDHISVVDPELPVPMVRLSVRNRVLEQVEELNGRKHLVQVLSYLPGREPAGKKAYKVLSKPLGECLARLGLALRGFFHPAADYELLWDLKQAAVLRDYLEHVSDPVGRTLVEHFLDRFEGEILPFIPKLRSQVIHNDFAPNNLVVAQDTPGVITGIIDFGDMIYTPLVMDLAPAIAYMFSDVVDAVDLATNVTRAYHAISPLEPLELSLLYDLVGTRLAMLNVIASWRVKLFPENEEYIAGYVDRIWEKLEAWRRLNPESVRKALFRACGYWEKEVMVPTHRAVKETRKVTMERREELLGPYAYLFYEEPLHIVRGEGVWLYDEVGNRYLDAYNNVPHVGHCHPHVVRAITAQTGTLNTSTRYLHGLILELAERITSRLPEPLRVCTFVCTGTEANELAWRMAKLYSGNDGTLITGHSYHGNSDAVIGFSSEEVPYTKLPPHVATLSAPLSNTRFRGPDSGISVALNTLEVRGFQPAMLILDTGFTSDGIFTAPDRYLQTLYDETREAGGLCVADEVQAGFGRFGEHFWGFEFDEVVPDIVTMGKPMGNGHPLAAVVTRPEIAAVIARETGYFNTFGGNPVSCAAGLAVLDVIEAEGLQENARRVGEFLKKRLAGLREDYPILGEIHGSGLLLGIDVVQEDGSPDGEEAKRIMNLMKENGVLIGRTGRFGNVLKIRPPIVFSKENGELFVEKWIKVLSY